MLNWFALTDPTWMSHFTDWLFIVTTENVIMGDCWSLAEWTGANNDDQLVAVSGKWCAPCAIFTSFEIDVISFCWPACLSAGMEWLSAKMGPRKVRRHKETSNTLQTPLASWHCALQQVSGRRLYLHVCFPVEVRAEWWFNGQHFELSSLRFRLRLSTPASLCEACVFSVPV